MYDITPSHRGPADNSQRRSLVRRGVVVFVGAGVALFSFVLYLKTLAPSVLPYKPSMPKLADSIMLQTQACVLGITHPTGYPSWVMLSYLITYLPFGDCAHRVNLSSAIYATLAVLLVYAAGLFLSRRIVAAAVGALAFGVSATFWSQAVMAEVYTLEAMFVALTLTVLFLWREKRRDAYLVLAAFCIALSMTDHMTSGLLLPGAFLFVAAVDWRKLIEWRLLLKGAGAFLIGLTPYLYLPIRAPTAPMRANNPDTLARFWWVVRGGNLDSMFLGFGPSELPHRFVYYWHHLLGNFGWWILSAGMIGFVSTLLWDRAVALLLGFLFSGWLLFALEDAIPDVFIYFIPTYLVIALWVSRGLGLLLDEAQALATGLPRVPRRAVLIMLPAVLLLMPLPGIPQAYAKSDMSHDYRGQKIMKEVARNVAPHATVLQHRTVLWYMVLVEKRRRDLTLVDPFQPTKHIPYNDVVWPGKFDRSTAKRRFGVNDHTGVTAARKAARRGTVYALSGEGLDIHHGLDPRPFWKAGFRTIHVKGPIYRLIPSGGGRVRRG